MFEKLKSIFRRSVEEEKEPNCEICKYFEDSVEHYRDVGLGNEKVIETKYFCKYWGREFNCNDPCSYFENESQNEEKER